MLLLVLDAELDQGSDVGVEPMVHEIAHGGIDVAPVVGDLHDARPRHQAPVGPRVPGSDAFVVRVEQEPEVRVEDLVARQRGTEQERFEEPRRVCAVPLGGTHIGHRLHRLVLGGQRGGQSLGQTPGGVEAPGE